MTWFHDVVLAAATGNAVILVTSEKSPVRLAFKAGFPAGIITVFTDAGDTELFSLLTCAFDESSLRALPMDLCAFVFTQDINKALRVARDLKAGNVSVNTTSSDSAYRLPFGGFKGSGIGR
ncbi:hypothetical protein ACHAPJ_006621 [Fusarium lateritium]